MPAISPNTAPAIQALLSLPLGGAVGLGDGLDDEIDNAMVKEVVTVVGTPVVAKTRRVHIRDI